MADDAETVDVSVTEESCGRCFQVSAWPHSVARVGEVVARACGSDAPNAGETATGPHGLLIRTGPLVWWVIDADDSVGDNLAGIGAEDGAVLDTTGNRKRFRVQGAGARAAMMRLAPIDYRDSAFPDGRFVSTSGHHISLQILRTGDAFDVFVTGSFARTLSEILAETG